MAATFFQLIQGTLFEMSGRSYAEAVYCVEGEDDPDAVMAALKHVTTGVPDELFDLPRSSVSIEPFDEGLEDQWRARVRYEVITTSISFPGSEVITSFTTGGRTERLVFALETIETYVPVGRVKPDFGGAIGVTREGIEGVDVVRGGLRRVERHQLLGTTVDTASFQLAARAATGKVNSTTFRGFAARTLLLESVEGRPIQGSAYWEVAFTWLLDTAETNIIIGDITVTTKPPNDYVWARYEEVEDFDAGQMVRRASAAVVDRVYDTADFATIFGI